MPATTRNDEVMDDYRSDFDEKVSELDFDVWGSEDDDGVARRRDPLRRRSSAAAPSEEEDDLV